MFGVLPTPAASIRARMRLTGMTFRHLCTLASCVALLALPADAAGASLVGKPLEKAMWGPTEIDGVSQFPIYKDLGVTLFQIQLRWERIAARGRPADPTNPDDPAYRWNASVDFAVQEAQKHGIGVVLLVQGAPAWANRSQGWMSPADDPTEYANFMTAAARRYPSVRHWMIWGEPLRNVSFPELDLSKESGQRRASVYAQMLDAAYGALKAQSKRNIVIGGNTFTTDRQRVTWAPVPLYEWMRTVRLPNGKVPRMDMWGHNPFSTRIPDLKDKPTVSLGDMSDTKRVLKNLKRYVSRPLKKRLPLFISEFCLPTGPNPLIPIELTQKEQATWLSRAFKIARSQKLVYSMGWFKLRDDPPPPGTDSANRCGLIEADGTPKLAYKTFKRASRRR